MFKVVADQLKVSDGWVRCGHCDGVFDASAHFQVSAAAESPAVLEAVVHNAPSSESEVRAEELPSVVQVPVSSVWVAHPPVDDASISAPLSNYLSAPAAADFPGQDDHARSQEGVERRALYGSTKSSKPLDSARTEDARRQTLTEVTFVQAAQRRDTPKNPLYKPLAVLFALVLLGALALQVLLHERDALAARYPALLPALEGVCQTMNCQISPPRVIEAVTIDSSAFTQTGPDAYRLNVVLQNTRLAVVAMPALEVTLTGSQNQVLIRKVLLPADIGATSHRLEQAIPFTGVFNLLLSLPAVAVAPLPTASSADAATPDGQAVLEAPAVSALITGYRLFAFYP